MQEITKNTDADTFRILGDEDTLDTPHRVLGTNTAESVAVNAGRNTAAGADASTRAKTILPKGKTVRTEDHGQDVFSRTLSDVKIVTKGGEVDYGFVTLNEGMSKYNIEHGLHPNPEQHEQFQEYYSDVGPYQYANGKKPLTQERYAEVASNIAAYTEAEKAYTDGDISREKYEEAMYNAYGKEHAPDVAAYRHMNMNWQRDMDMVEYDKSDKMAYLWSAQSQANRDIYDKAVRNTHTGGRSIPEKKQSFWQSMAKDTETMFSTLNDIAVIGRFTDLTNARIYGDDETEIADEELVRGLPVEWHDKVMQEAERYGDDAALQYRDNVTTSLTNAQAMSEMSLVTQIATAIPAVLLSPSTIIPGLAIGKGTVTAGRSIDMILKVGRAKNLAIPTKVAMWAAAGTAEAGIAGVARFATDDTFTSKDMLNEMKYGALFGAAVPAVIAGSTAGIRRVADYQSGMDKVIKGMRADTEAMVETPFKRPENKVRTQSGVEPYNEITGSQYLADKEAAQAMKTPRSVTGAKVDHVAGEAPKPMKVLTEDDLNYLDNAAEGIPQNPKPAEEIKAIKDAHTASRKELETQAESRMTTLLDSEAPVPHDRGKASATVDATTGTLTKSFTQKLLESDSKVERFLGTLLELPEGAGGKVIRKPTAALQQHSLRTRYLTQTLPQYHKLIGQYAGESGKRGVGKFMAQHADGQSNTMVKQFSREVVTTLEQRRQGRPVTTKSPSVLKMLDDIDGSMGKMFDDLVDAGVSGFRKNRRIKNYYPQLWSEGKVNGAVSQFGQSRVEQLLAKGYLESSHNSINSMNEAMKMAKNFMKNMDETDVQPDGAMPASMDARAKTRLDIDTTVTDGDLSIMDLMDVDVADVMAKYSNRAAGQVSLANAGIKSEIELDALRKQLLADGGDELAFEDTTNLLMGRPTRDGMDAGLNELKDAVSLSKMGGLGMAQLSEAGTILARTMIQLVDDPKVFKKIWSMAGESTDNIQLMRETQALSGISNDVHLLDRQATHLDTQEMAKINRVRSTAQWIAGKASFGKYKAPASHILGQVSGFNMIRRFQRRLTNASFMLDTAKAFKDGTGKMSEARMRDIGLDPQDVDLKRIFREVVSYDEHGIVSRLNLDQWDKKTREKYHLAMYRDDAQMVQQTIAGEMPQWINKPAMTLIAQFKQSAILANKKQLTRQMQFADKEAALGATMNAAMAGLTRTAKFGTLGAAAYAVTGDERELQKPWEKQGWSAEKYVSTFGFFPDMGHVAYDSWKAYDEDRMSVKSASLATAEEIPLLGWMKDYADIGMADSTQEKMDAAKGVAILGNMQFADIIYKGLEAQLED